MGARVLPVVLLIGSNIFMTFAWYGHLKFKEVALWKVILVSWLIALLEYCLQVPANRMGSRTYSPDQLKVIQEVITLSVLEFSQFFTSATNCAGTTRLHSDASWPEHSLCFTSFEGPLRFFSQDPSTPSMSKLCLKSS
jgi:uncharacterized protein (DUF486 family)